MRKYFRSLADVLASPIAAAANALRRDKAARQDRVLQSTKLEDMIYQGLHKDDDELIALEQSCTEKALHLLRAQPGHLPELLLAPREKT